MNDPHAVQMAMPSDEPEIGIARSALLTPPKASHGALLLVGSAAVFALVALQDRSIAEVLILVGVLLLHEFGHWVGMKLFGYRDVRMFFIPFFGAAVSGRSVSAPAWQEAIVLLLGPLPGIAIAIPVLLASIAVDSTLAADAGFMLIAINALNLLPVAPLDGGRLFQILIFSRQRVLEGAFLFCAAAALVAAALLLQDWVLGVLGAFMFLSLGRHWRVIAEASRLRAEAPALDAPPESIPEDALRALYQSASALVPKTATKAAALVAETMREMHQRIRRRPPSFGATVGLGSLWFAGVFAAAVGIFLYVLSPRIQQSTGPEEASAIDASPRDAPDR